MDELLACRGPRIFSRPKDQSPGEGCLPANAAVATQQGQPGQVHPEVAAVRLAWCGLNVRGARELMEHRNRCVVVTRHHVHHAG